MFKWVKEIFKELKSYIKYNIIDVIFKNHRYLLLIVYKKKDYIKFKKCICTYYKYIYKEEKLYFIVYRYKYLIKLNNYSLIHKNIFKIEEKDVLKIIQIDKYENKIIEYRKSVRLKRNNELLDCDMESYYNKFV
jgi:hypothetical protein